MSDNRFLKWVDLAIKNKSFTKYSVEIHGKTGKGDGYLGQITFASVTGTTKTGESKVLNLIIKTSTTNQLLRKQIPIKHFFENEIHIYDQVVPTLKTLGQDMGLKGSSLDFIPICYVTNFSDNQEILVLENLKFKGFDIWDRRIPMTYEHIRLVLQAYGKWNAFSFALKEKQPETFKKLLKQEVPMFAYYILKVHLVGVFFKFFEDVRHFWKEDPEVAQISFSLDDIKHIFSDLSLEDPDHRVILHGDSWTNNFMFKTEENSELPTDLRVIDWQCTGLGSPILDLSVFIYSCVDTGIYKNADTLLEIYYETLSEYLIELGCDPSQVFSYKQLTQHWKQFSKYGLFLGTFLLKFCLSEGEEAPDFVETAEQGKEFLENFGFNIANKETYFKRVRNNILHYIRNAE